MKKPVKKLSLHRETVLSMELELQIVLGGRPIDTKLECTVGCQVH